MGAYPGVGTCPGHYGTTKSIEFPYLSLTEKHDLIEHVEDLQPWLVDGEDDSTIGAGHSMKVS